MKCSALRYAMRRTLSFARRNYSKQHSLDSELRKRTLKWDELGLVCAAGAKISPPTPNPTQGFSLDYRVLGRQPTALGVLREFLPRRVWRDLAATTQNKIVVDLNSMLTPRNNRHANVPITPELLENIFITRLDMSLKPHHTIKAAYQNVPLSSPHLSEYLTYRNLIGIPNITTSLLPTGIWQLISLNLLSSSQLK